MKWFAYISLFVLTLMSGSYSHAQTPNHYVIKAVDYYKSQNFKEAKIWIDSALYNNQLVDDRSWMLRGLIYRGLNYEEDPEYRIIALESFNKVKTLTSNPGAQKQANSAIYNTNVKTYNEAIAFLKAGKLVDAEARYLVYKEHYLKYYDATFNFDETDIFFNNALGSAWQVNNVYAKREDQMKQLNIAVEKFQKTLAIDPDNYGANYGIGSAYFNQGANLIESMKGTATLKDLAIIQEIALKLFRNGLPYLLKAHELEPKNKEVIRGLRDIYRSMYDDEKFEYYNNLLEELKKHP